MKKTYIRNKNGGKTGADRAGVQGDLSAVLDPTRENEDPRVERPAIMIRSLRYLGESEGATPAAAMTPKSHALYEYLMASARLEITDATKLSHRVSYDDAKAYLETNRSERIREYVNAISTTWVSYDFVEKDGYQRIGKMTLLHCEEETDPRGEKFIHFSMHPTLRKIMLEAREYTHLEVKAFARFKCKYTARLYPKLALVSGMTRQHPIRYNPEDLAEELGYPSSEKFHFGHFEKNCLKPMFDDLSWAVKRFRTTYTLERSASRGKPVTAIVFEVSKSKKVLEEHQKDKVVDLDRKRMQKAQKESGLDISHIPHEQILAAAATKLQKTITEINYLWIEAVQRSMADPDCEVGSKGYIKGKHLLNLINNNGVAIAFKTWLEDWQKPDYLDDAPVPVEPEIETSEAVSEEKTTFFKRAPVMSSRPKILDEGAAFNGVEFEDASLIRIKFSDYFIASFMKSTITPEVKSSPFLNLDSDVGMPKTLRIEYVDDYQPKHMDFQVMTHPRMFPSFYASYQEHIDEVEFIA